MIDPSLIVAREDAWGPPVVPELLHDVPYAPFSKFDRLGKAADWTASTYGRPARRTRQYQSGQPVNTVFNFQITDDAQFQLVDNKAPVTRQAARGPGGRRPGGPWGGRGGRFGPREADRRDGGRDTAPDKRKPMAPRGKRDKRPFYRENVVRVTYSPSVDVDPEWDQIEMVHLPALAKLSLQVPPPTEVDARGTAPVLNKAVEVAGPRRPVAVPDGPAARWRSPRAVEDAVLMRELERGASTVVVTDKVLTALMTAARSVYPFDVTIHKRGGRVVVDRRLRSRVDLCTTHETHQEGIPEDYASANAVPALTFESDAVNNRFQAISATAQGERMGPEPEFEGGVPEGVPAKAYRYRRFDLGGGVVVCVRCEVDAVTTVRGQTQTVSVKALHEYDLRSGWRNKLQTQRGAVLGTEIKHNGFKVARWTAQALLGGIDRFSLGYVSRRTASNRDAHELLSVISLNPTELAQQIALNMDNCWGVFKGLVDLALSQEGDGLFLVVRDSSQPPCLKVLRVPEDEFDGEEPEGEFQLEEEDGF